MMKSHILGPQKVIHQISDILLVRSLLLSNTVVDLLLRSNLITSLDYFVNIDI